jgi:WhiB family transcriptional regulator, redox-sensing transcriptional regulator
VTRKVRSRGSQIGIGGAVAGNNDRLIDFFAVLRPQPVTVRAAAEDLSWQDRGRCAETDPDAFFPEKGGSTREAKRVCRSCEVRGPCLRFALEHDERFGIYGGMSERERRRLKRQFGDDTDAAVASVIPTPQPREKAA